MSTPGSRAQAVLFPLLGIDHMARESYTVGPVNRRKQVILWPLMICHLSRMRSRRLIAEISLIPQAALLI